MARKFLSGNEAFAEGIRLARPQVISAYQVARIVSDALKSRIGVKPYSVVVHPDGGLNTRSEHKSKRIIDERNVDYSI